MSISKKLGRNLSKEETALFRGLNTPTKIQDYIDKLPINFEKDGETYRSPREMIKQGIAHCFEGACLAAAAIYLNKLGRPLLLDFKINSKALVDDADHTVALFKANGLWGAISKTNHAVLRHRDPIYKSVRELAVSYFHEYFSPEGEKVLVSFSEPFDLVRRFGTGWITEEKDLYPIAEALDRSPHTRFYPPKQKKYLRNASKLEIEVSSIEEWKKV